MTLSSVVPCAAKTVNYCNCLPSYNYTQDGNTFIVNNGSCIRTNASELPWCFVIEDTCITPVLHRNGLGRNDSAWDTCLTTSEALSETQIPYEVCVMQTPYVCIMVGRLDLCVEPCRSVRGYTCTLVQDWELEAVVLCR